MIDAYAKAGEMELARLVFDEMSCRDVVSWNSVINGYGVVGSLDEAKKLFDQMPERNVDAVKMFRDMPRRDVVSWNAMLACYAQNGKSNEALALFDEIKVAGVRANEATIVSVLSEIGQLGGLDQGLQLHIWMHTAGSYKEGDCHCCSDVYLLPQFFCIFVYLSNGNQPWSLWFYSFLSIPFRALFLSQLSQIMFGLKGKFYVMIVKGCGVRRHKSGIGEKVWCGLKDKGCLNRFGVDCSRDTEVVLDGNRKLWEEGLAGIWIIWFWLGLYGWIWLSGGGKQWMGRGCVLWGQKFGVIEELWDRYGIAKRQNNKGSGAVVSLHMNGLWFRSVLG
ncbi:putative tetratricopeptide-like helical domain superfamily [Helianthus annuus]|uniref:Tetratricopeptide-like helical domain superfamily n=1 Tax=Helianthus annuus TaxID=4232 RepID=A0A9K3H8U5_HELAN|nr:putative tetratricopeptide-like helical domain superfamily [Helianthus annuus]KAJ0465299.1 putative tetratricopeptide-like helical domain superfamily [Helianthus annuus]KAJ0486891.1 putative tetratricopeptide-like helical domain superfamily [Helianthus annuus]KAJ0661023.1 putative tetratricopeptide-like helical domain superfamily [Helianthus annuus]KAJ0841558.1 putative tetratricopeptide-like helical domain superfamily [Helianthus annuus]